jgi:subfamily B ATP-binding cassette protein HlyB/CyaB
VDMSIGQRLDSLTRCRQPALPADAGSGRQAIGDVIHPRVQAGMVAARFHGMELDPSEVVSTGTQDIPSAASLSEWAQSAGMWARAVRLRWRQLMHFVDTGPVVLLLTDGSATLMVGADAERHVVFLRDPRALASEMALAVDELRLERIWSGEAVLLRALRGHTETDAPFTLSWLSGLVLQEKPSLRDIGLASLTLSFLTIFPPLLVMTVVDKVLTHHSYSTLLLLGTILAIATVYEAVLGYARRLIVTVVGARLDLHVFNRLLRLPLDYFERHPAGETMHKIAQVYKVREFLTGKLLTTFLDMMTLAVLLPFLFYLNSSLAFVVLACSALIVLVVLAYLRPLQRVFSKVIVAEAEKAAALGETIFGIKTVKSLALEPQRRMLWDTRVAEAGKARLAFGKLANWPQTIVNPIERFMSIGIVLVGAYLAMTDKSGYAVGALFAFMMLSMRVAQPLAGLARLIENYEEVGAAISEAASVLNRPLEYGALCRGLRPQLSGAIAFDDVSFTYGSTEIPALERVTFAVPAGTMLGIVGRSGSGKSTLTRLLQGINRDYSGFLKIDGNDVREINLRHLRQSFGVVLQENFLFRGSICENIIAGRPGLTLNDAVRAARLAGAEEFIERMPNGYETLIEEGSPNLSGGQRQRLAIARALITDPRILILDEAMSALDPESEAVLNANLLRIAHGRTMIIVSHRLSSLIDCDQILVLESGKAVDIAPHCLLLERCGIYRRLWTQQNRHLENQGPRHARAS